MDPIRDESRQPVAMARYPRERSHSFTTKSSSKDFFNWAAASYRSLSPLRQLVLSLSSVIGFVFVFVMKQEQLRWGIMSAAASTHILGQGGSPFDGLRFNRDGTFKISVFEDLHFGEGEETLWGPLSDIKSTVVMDTILNLESPNLAVLNGDLITGENTFLSNSTRYIDQIVSPLLNLSIPWASTYGNHDINYNLSTRALLAREKELGGSLALTKSMVRGEETEIGTSNYYIPIYHSNRTKGSKYPELAVLLWFFDSRGGRAFQKTDPNDPSKTIQIDGWVADPVTTWFRATSRTINGAYKRTIPSLAFVHIPVYATRAFQDTGAREPEKEPGINDDIIGHQGTTCDPSGECKYTGQDNAFMKALAETEGLMGVFSGHDHGDDWCFKWSNSTSLVDVPAPVHGNGIFLCFGRHTGYGGYGNWTRGSRQILLAEQMLESGEMETWVRLEDGGISGSVVLNATYGEDSYPRVERRRRRGTRR